MALREPFLPRALQRLSVVSSQHAAGAARVVITTGAGDSTQPVFFNYTAIVGPVLTGLRPATGPTSGNNVTKITGSNLLYATSVTFTQGATICPASISCQSDCQIAAMVPVSSVDLAQTALQTGFR